MDSFLIALVVGLLIAFGVVLRRLQSLRAALRTLAESVIGRQPFLREGQPAALGRDWDRLCEATSGLIARYNHLSQLSTGQLAQLEATLGSLQEGVLIVDNDNCIVLANQALQAIFPGIREILGQRVELVLPSRDFLDCVAAVRQGRAQPRYEVEFGSAAKATWVEATGTLIPPLDGAKGGSWALFVLHDVTKQRRLENVRREFVANVSHELRTPLSVIKGYIETLVDGHREMPIEDRERFLQTIQRHTERLNSLLEDLLTLSRLESADPGVRREPTDFASLINSIVDDYRARPAAAGHELGGVIDPTIGSAPIDPLKVTQVLENLIDNALKYTPAGTRIEVSARREGPEIEVVVRDTGPGIPAEDLPHLFERFYRVDKGRSREKGGTGLGLSIVKHIVQLHGGKVWVESRLGQGTAFHFRLPAAA